MTRHTTHFEDARGENMAAMLRGRVKGQPASEAAVELLIGDGRWLARRDFVAVALACGRDGVTGRAVAWIDWDAVLRAVDDGGLPCTASEAKVLAIAASIAAGLPVVLGSMLSGLDERSATAVAGAVLRAAGHSDLLVRRGAR